MHWLLWVLLVLSLWGGWNWFRYDRHVSHPPGIAVEAGPSIEVGSTRAPWRDLSRPARHGAGGENIPQKT